MNSITTFLTEVRAELGRVSWPTRRQLLVYTGVVIGLCLAVAIYLGGIDALLAWGIGRLVNR